jgi:uncharacterized protein YggT (Ycf19 family)
MRVIDFILNVVGLLLWLNWRALFLEPIARPGPSLVGTLKSTGPSKGNRWKFLAALVGILFFRAFFYWMIAPHISWVPQLSFGPASLAFGPVTRALRGDVMTRMLLFSVLSFCLTLAVFYLCLLFFSWLNSDMRENDPCHRFVQLHLGWLEALPGVSKLVFPIVAATLLWYGLNPVLNMLQIAPASTPARLIGQGALIGVAFFGHLQYPLIAVLVFHLIDSYVYLGDHAFWSWSTGTTHHLLRPMRVIPLVAGNVDFAPLIALGLLIGGPLVLGPWIEKWGIGLHHLFQRLVV